MVFRVGLDGNGHDQLIALVGDFSVLFRRGDSVRTVVKAFDFELLVAHCDLYAVVVFRKLRAMIYVISTIRLNRLLVYLDAAVDRALGRIEGEHIAERVAQDGGVVNLLLQGADFLADCLENIVQIARIRRVKIVVAVLRAVAQIPFPIRMIYKKNIIAFVNVSCIRII